MGIRSLFGAGMIAAAFLLPAPAQAHCDGLDGPVVAAARAALGSGTPDPALIWVQPADETQLRHAFAEAIKVRKLGPDARDLADRYFFETLVRLHRAGEGAPYTGLKPAGRDLGPAIPLADKAVATGSSEDLAAFIAKEAGEGVRMKFEDLQTKRGFRADDLSSGREYVASYVSFVHYVEGAHQALTAAAEGHYTEDGPAPAAHHE